MKKIIYTLFATVFLITSVSAQRVLTLDECIQIALDNNLDIKRARNEAISARAGYTRSKFDFLPDLSAGASHRWSEGLSFDQTSGTRVNTTTLGGGASIGASVTIFSGFSKNLELSRSKLLLEANEQTIESNIQSIEGNVVGAFLQVVSTQENLKIAEQTFGLLKEQLDREEKREKAGVGDMERVYNFRSQVAQQNLRIVELTNQLKSSELVLVQLLLLDPTEDFNFQGVSIEDAELEAQIADFSEVSEKSLAHSPAIKASVLNLEATKKSYKIAQYAWMPRLSASASYGSNWSSNLRNQDGSVVDISSQLENNINKGAGLNLSIPLFTNFQNRTRVQQTKIQVLNSEIGLQQEKNNLTNQVQRAYLDLVNAKTSYAAAKESLVNLQMAFEFAKSRYENGTIDFVTYLTSLNGKNTGELQLVQAKYTILFRQLILDIYTGELNNQN
ncbi:TolC family protein [uncultured Roseivirga sp.]|uniref:TolC family protein n=1 Tax=uncultured Roseivirga sp. TaxID=543088 RepID=UPI0030DB7AB5|tara:strand:+ start:174729 stop:176066 length:1338 start_codon:yes stop_codon:yes gene_type:complete